MNSYDYIFAGGGASGLITAYRISRDPFFANKQILIIDKDEKNSNDRTWCFWEEGAGEWDNILTHTWDKIIFKAPNLHLEKALSPFRYKMLRSSDLYAFIKNQLSHYNNISIVTEKVIGITEEKERCIVSTAHQSFEARECVLNSIQEFNPIPGNRRFPYLKQHFVGWFIRTGSQCFDPSVATFMDFDIPQKGNTRFIYVLPTSTKEALVEYTLFSEHLLEFSEYEEGIQWYLERQGIRDFQIIEKEMGNIPMTCYPLHQKNTDKLIHIGSAGGWTKASTGFTFMNICRNSAGLTALLKSGGDTQCGFTPTRYQWYDRIFIEVLAADNASGTKVFSSLFEQVAPDKILRFLNNESSSKEDLEIILKTKPKSAFTAAFFRTLFK